MLESRSVKTTSALFVAQLADSSSYIVIMSQNRNMAAYTYDNTKTTTWFTGTLQDGHFLGTAKNGSSMAAVLKDGTISGKLNVTNNSSLNFTALPAEKLEADVWLALSQGFIKWLGSSDGMQTFKLEAEVTEETPDLTEPAPSDGTQVTPSGGIREDACKYLIGFWKWAASKQANTLLKSIDRDEVVNLYNNFYWLWNTGCSDFGDIHNPTFT
jgi:hypothetical protein